MWDGANPQSSARRRRDASDVGRLPFGAALYSRLSAAHEARGRSSPSRVPIADAWGRRAFPLPPQQAPPGIVRTVARFPQFRRAQSAQNAQLPSQVRSTKSAPPSAAALPMLPRAALPPSHPRLAAWQAVRRGHPPSRIQGALPRKAPAPGCIRLGNKRAGAPGKPGPGEIAVDIDRKNRGLGKPTPPPASTSSSASAPNTRPTSNAMAP